MEKKNENKTSIGFEKVIWRVRHKFLTLCDIIILN